MIGASNRHGVPLGVLYAVGLVESGNGRSLHALAVNVEGVAHYPATGPEAIATVLQAQQAGVKLIDVGCMQINLHFHRSRFASLEDMFDPSRNVAYGAAYLSSLHARTRSWTEAVARYHAGPANFPAQAKYVCAVIRKLVAAGLGAWTGEARAACSTQPDK
ncbi:MAG: transglycosylase SLT domain-containing protein [Rhodoblastus sp.]